MCSHSETSGPTIALRTVQTRVHNAAKKLDKSHKGWHKKIKNLDVQRDSRCVAGQLGLSDTRDVSMAFNLPMYTTLTHKGQTIGKVGSLQDSHKVYDTLTRLWNHQIAVRVRKDKRSKVKAKSRKKVRDNIYAIGHC